MNAFVYASTRLQVALPGRKELEEQANEKFGDIDREARKRLEEGVSCRVKVQTFTDTINPLQTGRFQVFLNLISSDTKPLSSDDFFATNRLCRCCSKHAR